MSFVKLGTVQYVECPSRIDLDWYKSQGYVSIFLAGGIRGCEDWQAEVTDMLVQMYQGKKLIILNPRRAAYDYNSKGVAEEQITWEHDMLHKADTIFFWFPATSSCPIALFEFGFWLAKDPLKVAWSCQKGYPRAIDVDIQTNLIAKRYGLPWGLSSDEDNRAYVLAHYGYDIADNMESIHDEQLIQVLKLTVDNTFLVCQQQAGPDVGA